MGLFSDSLGGSNSPQDWMPYRLFKLNENVTNDFGFPLTAILFSLSSLLLAWFLGSCIWYRYLSPLSHVPGPVLASFSRLWLIKFCIRGKGGFELVKLHEKHGE